MRAWWAARRLRTKIVLVVLALFALLVVFTPPRATVAPASTTNPSPSSTVVAAASATPAAAASTAAPAPATPASATPAPVSSPTAAASPTACHSANGLPDRGCTPGVADPRVTQANIATTICVSGYTTTVRPPTSYTDPLKVQQMALYGETGSTANYEEDHLIALELGGDPRAPANLWPEPRRSIGGRAEDKDTLENRLHSQICNGTITLAAAQQCIAIDWVACLLERP